MKKLRIFQKGWNYRQDGPGNRLVYHLQGCNFHCPWCANPEGMPAEGTILVRKDKLIPAVCPHGAIHGDKLDRKICCECESRECVNVNLNQGIELSCKDFSCEQLLEEVLASRHLFHSGGGVTLSGGEPTIQYDAVKHFLSLLKAEGINTAIETNGSHPELEELYSVIDTLIIDWKHFDSDRAFREVGSKTSVVLENISRAAEGHGNLLVRITLVPGFNSAKDDIIQFLSILQELPGEHLAVEFLAYHEFCRVKWEECGMDYKMNVSRDIREDIAGYESLFRKAGINMVRT